MAQFDDDRVMGYVFNDRRGDPLHCGISNDPERREREHQRSRDPGGVLEVKTGWMRRDEGRAWERQNGCSPYGSGPARTPEVGSASSPWGTVAGILGVGALLLIGSLLFQED